MSWFPTEKVGPYNRCHNTGGWAVNSQSLKCYLLAFAYYQGVPVITATSRNGDNKNGDMPKRLHSKTATTRVKTATTRVKTATTISQNGDKHWSKRRQPLVKTVKNFGQNGKEFWSKRRQSLVKTATVVSQNGDSSQSGLWFKTAKNLAVINNNSLIARHFSKKIQTGSVGFLDTTFVKTATVVSQDFCTKRRRI